MHRTTPPDSRRAIAAWLFACCALVFAMVVVGGITRLTHSGLSIVEWKPVIGAIPPLDDGEWQAEFDKYKLSPEYKQRNFDMTLDGFKGIFWWEYGHRLLGRVIGAAFFLPFLYFLFRGAIRGALAWRLAGIFFLGGLQGAVGWFMVASGLVDDPRVSSLLLAAHLGLAFLIYGAMLWVALGLVTERGPRVAAGLVRFSRGYAALVFAMVLSGALVAGIRAGLAYNTFPLMNGQWIPDEILVIEPWWKNFVFNMATVQFDHRVIAMLVFLGALSLWAFTWIEAPASRAQRSWSNALLAAAILQVCAGIATLLMKVPTPLAAVHQAGALVVFTCALGLSHALQGGSDYNGKGGTG
jgi:cytochrome c oxidase assembly protein subunit 15